MDKAQQTGTTGSYSHIIKSVGLFGGVQGIGILVTILRTKLIAVLLGPMGVGLLSLFNSTTKLLSESTNLGLSMSAVKTISEAYDTGNDVLLSQQVRLVRSLALFTALLGMAVCLLLAPFFNWYTFSWKGHFLHFVCLSPVVGMAALTGGELAILKGVRRLRLIASSTVYGLIASLLISIPLFWQFGVSAIVPSLVLTSLAQLLIVVGYSWRLYPLRLSFRRRVFRDGYGMIRLGIGFVVAGILNSGADFFIRSYLNNVAQIQEVGFYNAGFMMTITYAGMVFSAMETDYFPRLSAIRGIGSELNDTVNRQIEVTLLLLSPMLVFFLVALPILLPLLYSGRFLPALGMMQVMVLAMFVRAVKLPVAYVPLAKGNSRLYLLLEGLYDVVIVLLTVWFYRLYGLLGAGIAITVASLLEFLWLNVSMYLRYGYTMSRAVVRYVALQWPLGLLAFGVTFIRVPWLYWLCGILLVLVSLGVSVSILRKKTHLWNRLKSRLVQRNAREQQF